MTGPEAPKLKYALARRFRKALTPPEARLWARLKGKPDGLHFRKQHPIGVYIVDFYCAGASLIVEIEGQIHNNADIGRRDDARFAWLESQGLEVLRIAGADIMRDPDEVALGIITHALAKLKR